MSVKIKICGSRRPGDIELLNKNRPDYAGFILSSGFGRSVDLETFLGLEKALDKKIKRVGVFVNEPCENIMKFEPLLDVIQLHGNEDESYISTLREKTNCEIWKAVRARCSEDIEKACRLSADRILIDSFFEDKDKSGVSKGRHLDLEIVKNADISKPFFIAGGLSPENVSEVIAEVQPFGVDVSSGVEKDGAKDGGLVEEFVKNAGVH